jgi:hypothetical protein
MGARPFLYLSVRTAQLHTGDVEEPSLDYGLCAPGAPGEKGGFNRSKLFCSR